MLAQRFLRDEEGFVLCVVARAAPIPGLGTGLGWFLEKLDLMLWDRGAYTLWTSCSEQAERRVCVTQ